MAPSVPHRPHRRTVLAALAAGAFAGAAHGAGGRITLAFVPQENPEKLLGDIEAITRWLSAETGLAVSGFVTADHAAAIEALRNGDADISFMGALPFVLAEAEIGAEPLLSEVYRGAATYRGRIFVLRDGPVRSLADLAGRSIAFADPISESGYLFPLDLFVGAGLAEDAAAARRFFDQVYFAGGYQQAMQALAEGLVDAAGASEFADLLLTPEQRRSVTWIAETEPIPSHVVIARPDLDEGARTVVVAALLRLNEPANRPLLAHLYGPEGYVVADLAAFEPVRALARRHGLLE